MLNVLKNELIKLFARRKIYVFLSILLIVSLAVLASSLITRNLNSFIKEYGQTFPLTLFDSTASIIIPIFIIILIADLVTEEYVDGSLKLSLLRPVSRRKLLLGKMGALVIGIMVLLLFLLILGYAIGILIFGWGDQFLIKGRTLTTGEGLLFTLKVYMLSLLPYASFGALILLFAVFMSNTGSVVGIGIGILLISLLTGQVFPELSAYLISSYFNTLDLLTSDMGAPEIICGLSLVAIYGILFYALSSWGFSKKDLLL